MTFQIPLSKLPDLLAVLKLLPFSNAFLDSVICEVTTLLLEYQPLEMRSLRVSVNHDLKSVYCLIRTQYPFFSIEFAQFSLALCLLVQDSRHHHNQNFEILK